MKKKDLLDAIDGSLASTETNILDAIENQKNIRGVDLAEVHKKLDYLAANFRVLKDMHEGDKVSEQWVRESINALRTLFIGRIDRIEALLVDMHKETTKEADDNDSN